jgi:hypothetical protein
MAVFLILLYFSFIAAVAIGAIWLTWVTFSFIFDYVREKRKKNR